MQAVSRSVDDDASYKLQIGSFFKALSASVRCGFIVARPDWIDGLCDSKIATCFGGAGLPAELVLTLLQDGSYRRQVEALRLRLARAMAETCVRRKAIGISRWIEPQAGMFVWCHLPEGVDAAKLARWALTARVLLAPGNVFSLSGTASSFLRFDVAQSGDGRIFKILEEAMMN